jgi:adenylate cyclase
VLGRAAVVLGRFGEDIDAALSLIDRALVLNPSFAFAWYWSGWLRLFAGDTDLAIQHFETSMRLNPRGQRGYHLSGIGMAHFLNRRFDDALVVLRVSLEEVPIFTATYRSLAACYAHLGRLEEARSIIKRMASLTPVLAPSTNPLRDPEHRELFRSGLRLAAGET